MAVDTWRFSRVFLRGVAKLDAGEASRHMSQFKYYIEKIEQNLNSVGVRMVNLEGQKYDSGMAVKALNISDFRPDDEMHIEQMLEPIVMGVVYPDAADAFARWIVKEDRANPEAMIKKLWSRVDGLHHLNI